MDMTVWFSHNFQGCKGLLIPKAWQTDLLPEGQILVGSILRNLDKIRVYLPYLARIPLLPTAFT